MSTPIPQNINHVTGSYDADGGYTHLDINVITTTLTPNQIAALTSDTGHFRRYCRVPYNTPRDSATLLTHLLDSDALDMFGDVLTATIPMGSASFSVPDGIVVIVEGDHVGHALTSAGYQTGWQKVNP